MDLDLHDDSWKGEALIKGGKRLKPTSASGNPVMRRAALDRAIAASRAKRAAKAAAGRAGK